jgi:hypothetical protein
MARIPTSSLESICRAKFSRTESANGKRTPRAGAIFQPARFYLRDRLGDIAHGTGRRRLGLRREDLVAR